MLHITRNQTDDDQRDSAPSLDSLDSLAVERDALLQDKARLDWLETSNAISPEQASLIVNGRIYLGKYYGTMREAIDAAMKTEKP